MILIYHTVYHNDCIIVFCTVLLMLKVHFGHITHAPLLTHVINMYSVIVQFNETQRSFKKIIPLYHCSPCKTVQTVINTFSDKGLDESLTITRFGLWACFILNS